MQRVAAVLLPFWVACSGGGGQAPGPVEPAPVVAPPIDAAPPSDADTSELGMGIHGGHRETSVMMHLRPDLVHLERASRNVPEWLAENEHVRFGGTVQFGWLSNDFGPDGHIGDPTGASADAGKVMFEDAVRVVCDQLREIATFDFP